MAIKKDLPIKNQPGVKKETHYYLDYDDNVFEQTTYTKGLKTQYEVKKHEVRIDKNLFKGKRAGQEVVLFFAPSGQNKPICEPKESQDQLAYLSIRKSRNLLNCARALVHSINLDDYNDYEEAKLSTDNSISKLINSIVVDGDNRQFNEDGDVEIASSLREKMRTDYIEDKHQNLYDLTQSALSPVIMGNHDYTDRGFFLGDLYNTNSIIEDCDNDRIKKMLSILKDDNSPIKQELLQAIDRQEENVILLLSIAKDSCNDYINYREEKMSDFYDHHDEAWDEEAFVNSLR